MAKKVVKKKSSKKTTKKKAVKTTDPGATPDFIKDHAVEQHEEATLSLPKDHLEQLTMCVGRMVTLKEIHKKNKDTNARVWAEFQKYESNALGLLKTNKLPNFTSETHKIGIKVTSSILVPKTDVDKKKLFDWIETNKGVEVLFAYQSISSSSLKKFYEIEADLHFQKTGNTSFEMDGVPTPKSYESLSLTKNKK